MGWLCPVVNCFHPWTTLRPFVLHNRSLSLTLRCILTLTPLSHLPGWGLCSQVGRNKWRVLLLSQKVENNSKSNSNIHPTLAVGYYLVAKSYETLCDPTDCIPPSSSVHAISQARILGWVITSFSIPLLWNNTQVRYWWMLMWNQKVNGFSKV